MRARARNSYLKEAKELPLGKLYIRIIGLSMVFNALVYTLKQKEKQGYFES